MPQTIYLPENPNSKLVRALAGNYMQMMMAKSMKEPDLVPGEDVYWQKKGGKLVKTDTPIPKRGGGAGTSYQRKTRTIMIDGKPHVQEFNFNPDTGKSEPYGDPYPKVAKGAGGAVSASQMETRLKNLTSPYMPTKDKFGQYEEITPEQRMPRFVGWLRSRERESKFGTLSQSELNRGEQAIMTNLRLDMRTQEKVLQLRKEKAPLSKIIKELRKGNNLGASTSPEGTTATNAKGERIVTRNGKWVLLESKELAQDNIPPAEVTP